jgi:hypothetical protein
MSVGIEVECAEIHKEGFDCEGSIVSAVKPLVEAIPQVGDFAAKAWEVSFTEVCTHRTAHTTKAFRCELYCTRTTSRVGKEGLKQPSGRYGIEE